MNDLSVDNSPFKFSFAGKDYEIKKANLRQVIAFQRKTRELTEAKDAAADLLMASYAIWLAIHEVDKSITEEYILDNTAGDIDVMEILGTLGFMSQQKVEMAKRVRDALAQKSQ